MTPYIEAKKAEVRKKLEDFLSVHERWQGSSRTISTDLEPFLGEIVDTLLDEIESRVLAVEDRVFAEERGYQYGFVKEAFQHLRTGETN